MEQVSVKLLIVSGVIFLALVYVYLRLMLDRTRGLGLRLFFICGLFGMLGLLCLINLRANASMLFYSNQQLCAQRLEKLHRLLKEAQVLERGGYPATLDGLKVVPDFRWHDLVCPDTGRRYEFRVERRMRKGRPIWLYWLGDAAPHRSESPWLLELDGRHLQVNGRLEWMPEQAYRSRR